jgi:hypothetical protein
MGGKATAPGAHELGASSDARAGRPMRLPAAYARAVIDSMGTCPGFDATLTATLPRRFLAGPPIEAPVTVAFGSRDLVLLPTSPATSTSSRPAPAWRPCPPAATCPCPTTPGP